MTEPGIDVDRIDLKILHVLQQDGRISNLKLAEAVALSPTAVLARVQRCAPTLRATDQVARRGDRAPGRPRSHHWLHAHEGGTATKIILNTISTAAMVKIGKVYGNLMVDLQVTCQKLQDRGERILMDTLSIRREEASRLLEESGGHVKTAIVMSKLSLDADEARHRLENVGGSIADVVGNLRIG